MALALYRRYRPDTFDGVIGQDQVTVPLMRALDQGKLTHAYLFSGPRGCGKTSSARILARCVNCAQGPTSHPCGECESCKDLATGGPGSIDVVEIDAASHNGVDDARELRERAGFAPARDRYKIFILDEAHMVTPQGFNALLKIVEEPPEHVMFIFATTEPEKVIGTIRSRTHHYPFRLVPQEVMGPYLERICEQEGIRPEPGVLKLAMRAGGGSMRDTLSVLDQLMVGAVDGAIPYDSAVALLGFTPEELIGEAVDAVIAKDGEALYGVVQKVVIGGFDPRRFVEDLLARVRDLLVLTLGGERAEHVLGDDAASDMDGLHRQAAALSLPELTACRDGEEWVYTIPAETAEAECCETETVGAECCETETAETGCRETEMPEAECREAERAETDSSGIPPLRLEEIDRLLAVTDLVMLDIKHIRDEEHRKLTGHSNRNVLAFAKYLEKKQSPVWIRHVVVPGITFDEAELTELGNFIGKLSNLEKLEVLPYHALGEVKYENLGIDYALKGTPQLTKEEAALAENIIKAAMKKS